MIGRWCSCVTGGGCHRFFADGAKLHMISSNVCSCFPNLHEPSFCSSGGKGGEFTRLEAQGAERRYRMIPVEILQGYPSLRASIHCVVSRLWQKVIVRHLQCSAHMALTHQIPYNMLQMTGPQRALRRHLLQLFQQLQLPLCPPNLLHVSHAGISQL